MNLKLMGRIASADKYFTSPEHKKIVETANRAYQAGKYGECERILDSLPTAEQLLNKLIEKLHGKSVYKTLKAIQEGKAGNTVTNTLGLSSLLTHSILEVKSGKNEYKWLVRIIGDKLVEAIYSL